jgi:hypothetical protein
MGGYRQRTPPGVLQLRTGQYCLFRVSYLRWRTNLLKEHNVNSHKRTRLSPTSAIQILPALRELSPYRSPTELHLNSR